VGRFGFDGRSPTEAIYEADEAAEEFLSLCASKTAADETQREPNSVIKGASLTAAADAKWRQKSLLCLSQPELLPLFLVGLPAQDASLILSSCSTFCAENAAFVSLD
jgi:hypothetical protein